METAVMKIYNSLKKQGEQDYSQQTRNMFGSIKYINSGSRVSFNKKQNQSASLADRESFTELTVICTAAEEWAS
jgi:hypothetical protein